jgi:adenine deaminase
LTVKRESEAFLAVGRAIGDVADLAERLHQIVGGVAVVLDNEKAHGRSLRWESN